MNKILASQIRLNQIKFGALFLFVALLIVAFLPLSKTAAHRYHTSLTRIDYNQEEQLAEITLQLFLDDFEAALKLKNGKSVKLDKTPQIDRLILEYLSDKFVIKDQTGTVKQLRYVGFERTGDAFRLYVETSLSAGFDGATLANTVLFDQFDDQVNLVTTHFNHTKTDLVFRANDKEQDLVKKAAPTAP